MTEYQRTPDRRLNYWVEARHPKTGQLMERVGPVDADHADIIAWAMDSRRDTHVLRADQLEEVA